MPYKPTGNPSGRPKKSKTEPVKEPAKVLTRAHKAFQRIHGDPSEGLHRPPRSRLLEVSRRPMLHPNVIAKA